MSEIIWFGFHAILKHLQNTVLRLHVEADSIVPSELVRDLGVFLDSELTMRKLVGKGCCGRFGRGASLYRHRSQLFERLWVRLPLPTKQFSEI